MHFNNFDLINKDVVSIVTWGAFTIMHATLLNP